MAPNLPSRYQTQVRLGRDGDIEEWLATDTVLDRPVLVRALNPDAIPERRDSFLESARAAATVSHNHLESVYDVGNHEATAHMIVEWTGGVTISDRLGAGDTIPLVDFLPNAAGLADGLATLHAAGIVHGAIDSSAIHFSASHPAKLGAFGRTPVHESATADTAALAGSLRIGVTGLDEPGVRPSQVVEGLSPRVDRALALAESGSLEAAGLAGALRAIPQRREVVPAGRISWSWLVFAGVMIVAAVLIAVVGLTLDPDPDSPFLFPASPQATEAAAPTTNTTLASIPTAARVPSDQLGYTASVYDPFGEGTENDAALSLLSDNDASTAWQTERYFGQLASFGKPGVGVSFAVDGMPRFIEVRATPGTTMEVRWSNSVDDEPESWEQVAWGRAAGPATSFQLPARERGRWLLWLTELPEPEDGVFVAEVAGVVFRP